VLRYFEQVEDTQKSRLARQFWRNIRKSDRFDGVHLDLAFPYSVSDTHCDVRTHPDSDTARDLSATDSLAKTLGEHHAESLILRIHREPALWSCCGHGGLFTIADYCIGQSVLERSEPGLVVPPLQEPLADNRLADLL
jgi:hypothetical protein